MGLTQEAFAIRFNFNQLTVEGWQQGRPVDDGANTYLHVIGSNTSALAEVLEDELA